MANELVDVGAQPERTSLSWLRTAASITFAALLLFRYLLENSLPTQAFLLAGTALLISPIILLAAIKRVRSANGNWEQADVSQPRVTLFVALAVCGVGIVSALVTFSISL